MRIVARSTDAEPVFSLEPGTYVLHAAYGFASGTKRVTLGHRRACATRSRSAPAG